ncbi:carboxymuconolactone decarboxylase [Catenulispora yoronensis]
MAMTSETPVLDTIAAMTVDSLENCGMEPHTLILTRLAALVAMDAPPISYLAHIGAAQATDVTAEQVQDLLVAIAPIVGTARVMSAAGHITQAMGFAIAVAVEEASEDADMKARANSGGNGSGNGGGKAKKK